MAQENEHVKKLIAARERMIQDRRNLADALANEYKGGHTERMRDSFVVTQNAIEAIDDERCPEPGEHLRPIGAHRRHQRKQRARSAAGGEHMHGKGRRGARASGLSSRVDRVHRPT